MPAYGNSILDLKNQLPLTVELEDTTATKSTKHKDCG